MRNAGGLSAGFFFACDLRVGHITYGTAGRPRMRSPVAGACHC